MKSNQDVLQQVNGKTYGGKSMQWDISQKIKKKKKNEALSQVNTSQTLGG